MTGSLNWFPFTEMPTNADSCKILLAFKQASYIFVGTAKHLSPSANLQCVFRTLVSEQGRMAQLLVVAFLLLCLHSCDSSSCLGMSFMSMLAVWLQI